MKLTVHEQNQATLDTGEDPCLFQAPRGLKGSGDSRGKDLYQHPRKGLPPSLLPSPVVTTTRGEGGDHPHIPDHGRAVPGSAGAGLSGYRGPACISHSPVLGIRDARGVLDHTITLPRPTVSRVGGVIHTAPLPGVRDRMHILSHPCRGYPAVRLHRSTGTCRHRFRVDNF